MSLGWLAQFDPKFCWPIQTFYLQGVIRVSHFKVGQWNVEYCVSDISDIQGDGSSDQLFGRAQLVWQSATPRLWTI